MGRLINSDSSATGQLDGCFDSPSFLLRRRTLYAFSLQRFYERGQVVAHEVEVRSRQPASAVKLTSLAVGRVDRGLGRWQRKEQPTSAGVDSAKIENITKESTVGLRVVAVEEDVSASDSGNHDDSENTILKTPRIVRPGRRLAFEEFPSGGRLSNAGVFVIRRSVLELLPFTSIYRFRGIDRLIVDLFIDDFSGFVDQESCTPRRFHRNSLNVELLGQSITACDWTTPVSENREGHSILLGKCEVREGAVHAHTQHLGVGAFQLGQILLESLHFAGSTTGESKDKKCQGDIFLSPIVLQ